MFASPRPYYTTTAETVFTPDLSGSRQYRMLDFAADFSPLCCVECRSRLHSDDFLALEIEHNSTGRPRHGKIKCARFCNTEICLTRASNNFMEKNPQFSRVEVWPYKKVVRHLGTKVSVYHAHGEQHPVNAASLASRPGRAHKYLSPCGQLGRGGGPLFPSVSAIPANPALRALHSSPDPRRQRAPRNAPNSMSP